jgi:hypothetical protein
MANGAALSLRKIGRLSDEIKSAILRKPMLGTWK